MSAGGSVFRCINCFGSGCDSMGVKLILLLRRSSSFTFSFLTVPFRIDAAVSFIDSQSGTEDTPLRAAVIITSARIGISETAADTSTAGRNGSSLGGFGWTSNLSIIQEKTFRNLLQPTSRCVGRCHRTHETCEFAVGDFRDYPAASQVFGSPLWRFTECQGAASSQFDYLASKRLCLGSQFASVETTKIRSLPGPGSFRSVRRNRISPTPHAQVRDDGRTHNLCKSRNRE